jgi:hypothetical protein
MARLDDMAVKRKLNEACYRAWNAPPGKKRQRQKELSALVHAQLAQEVKAQEKAKKAKRKPI